MVPAAGEAEGRNLASMDTDLDRDIVPISTVLRPRTITSGATPDSEFQDQAIAREEIHEGELEEGADRSAPSSARDGQILRQTRERAATMAEAFCHRKLCKPSKAKTTARGGGDHKNCTRFVCD